MDRRKSALAYIAAIAAVALVVVLLLLVACSHRRAQVTQLSLEPPSVEQPAEGQESSSGVLPGVMALDGCIGAARSVSEGETVPPSQGWEAYINDQTGTNGTSGLNVEMDGTALMLRAYAPGEYAYAVYGQSIGPALKPLQTLIDSSPCSFGGGQDDDVPACYYIGVADYSQGSWRWFGPFGEYDVMLTVNSATLKSRFKSPENNFYLCVLASNGSKAVSALPDDGLVTDFPIEPVARAVSAEDDDPGGLTIEEIVTWVADNLYTEPAAVTGLHTSTSSQGVTLNWDRNPDPDVDIYQIFRRDADTEDPRELIATVFAPDTDIIDATSDPVYPMFNWDVGMPGKKYTYSVRARNDAGYGGYSIVSGIRLMTAPTVNASDGVFGDRVHIEWSAVEGAVGYIVWRADAAHPDLAEVAQLDGGSLSYDDYGTETGTDYFYWVSVDGEDLYFGGGQDEDIPYGGPNIGFCIELEALQVTATDGDYPGRVELVWGELEEPPAYYEVCRDTDEIEGGDEESLGSVFPPDHAFTDTTAPWDEQRYYFVRPGGGDPGIGDWGHRGLDVPEGEDATSGTLAAKVAVSWGAVNNATRYRVYRSTSALDPDPTYLGEAEAPATNYDDTTAAWSGTEGVHYFYFISALHTGPDSENSGFSASAEGWRGIGEPQNVLASDGTNTTGVNVSWAAVTGATHYRVYRSVVADDPGPTLLTTVAAPASGYSDTTAAHNTLYWYSVSALYSGDEGEKSGDDSGYVGLAPPLNVQASDDLEDSIEITWSAVTGATGYTIYRADSESGTYTQIGTDDASPFTDGPFAPNTTYWYKLKATNSLATSAFSGADEGNVYEGWVIQTLAYNDDDIIHSYLDIVGDRPAIAFYGETDHDVPQFIRASDATGSSWDSVVTIDSSYNNDEPVMTMVSGHPAVCYNNHGGGQLKFCRASNPEGSSWNEPVIVAELSTTYSATFLDIAIVNGNPAIAYYTATSLDTMYVRATDANGASWGNPIEIDTDGYVGSYVSLAVANGHPAVAYYDDTNKDLKYARSVDANGDTWGTPIAVQSAGSCGYYLSLCVVNGNPAISYSAFAPYRTEYIRASDSDGATWGTPITVRAAFGRDTCLAIVSGRPAISSRVDGFGLEFVWAQDVNGAAWGPSEVVENGNVGYFSSLVEVDGCPAISYGDGTNVVLKYARLQ